MKFEVKAHENVTRKGRFHKPNRPAPGGASNPDAGVENPKASDFGQSDGGDVLMLRMCLDTKPQPLAVSLAEGGSLCVCGSHSHKSKVLKQSMCQSAGLPQPCEPRRSGTRQTLTLDE
jgi:hypothetical protein